MQMTFNSRDKNPVYLCFLVMDISSCVGEKASSEVFISSAEFKGQADFKRVIWNSLGRHANKFSFEDDGDFTGSGLSLRGDMLLGPQQAR